MDAFQSRVIVEKDDLDIQRTALAEFCAGVIYNGLSMDEKLRLKRQYNAMTDYSVVLGERIKAFKKGKV